jgi:hypothetical protein
MRIRGHVIGKRDPPSEIEVVHGKFKSLIVPVRDRDLEIQRQIFQVEVVIEREHPGLCIRKKGLEPRKPLPVPTVQDVI